MAHTIEMSEELLCLAVHNRFVAIGMDNGTIELRVRVFFFFLTWPYTSKDKKELRCVKSFSIESGDPVSPVLACTLASGDGNSERLMWAHSNGIIKVIDINVGDFGSSLSEESSEDTGTKKKKKKIAHVIKILSWALWVVLFRFLR